MIGKILVYGLQFAGLFVAAILFVILEAFILGINYLIRRGRRFFAA